MIPTYDDNTVKILTKQIYGYGNFIFHILDMGFAELSIRELNDTSIKQSNIKKMKELIGSDSAKALIGNSLIEVLSIVEQVQRSNKDSDTMIREIGNISIWSLYSLARLVNDGRVNFIFDNIDVFEEQICSVMRIISLNMLVSVSILGVINTNGVNNEDSQLIHSTLKIFSQGMKLLDTNKYKKVQAVIDDIGNTYASTDSDFVVEDETVDGFVDELKDNIVYLHPGTNTTN